MDVAEIIAEIRKLSEEERAVVLDVVGTSVGAEETERIRQSEIGRFLDRVSQSSAIGRIHGEIACQICTFSPGALQNSAVSR